ncbi:MAG: hypothetical protein ACHP84_08640 [Caulobacterales bacterium]
MSQDGAGTSNEGAGEAPRQVFSPMTGLWIVLVGVFAFSAFVALLAYAPDLRRDSNCRENVFSKCAVGFAGLAEVVQSDGTAVIVSRTPLPRGRVDGLLIATPESATNLGAIAKLGFSGPVLVVLPKWVVAADPLHPGWGRKLAPVNPDEFAALHLFEGVGIVQRARVARPRLAGQGPLQGLALTPGPVDHFQTLSVKGWAPVLTDETGAVVMAQAPNTNVFLLADPDFLNVQGLADLDSFTAGVSLLRALRAGEGPVIFDVTLNGYQTTRSILRLIFDPPFLAVTLCLAAALALAGVQTAVRFGPLRRDTRVFAHGKEALADNTAQLIRLARREARMAPRYVALTRNAAARAVGAPRDLTGEALTTFLDRLAQQRGAADSLAALTADADRVRDRAGLAKLAQRLFRWRLEMTRERQ